uniref:Disease resistance protein RPM1 n=1 Tax=Aegilops tauschii subsp. strangulata TaxID=200361 RepID=A0A453QJ64_AEGTS
MLAMATTNYSGVRGTFYQPPTPEENTRMKLAEWIDDVAQRHTAEGEPIPSVAIVALDKEETLAIAKEASAMWKKHCPSRRSVMVDIPAVHLFARALRTRDILYYILRKLQSAEPQPQQQQGQVSEDETEKIKSDIRLEKWRLLNQLTEQIQVMNLDNKFEEIKNIMEKMKGGQLQINLKQMDEDPLGLPESVKDKPLGVLLQALWQLKHKPAEGAPATKQDLERKEDTIRDLERKEDTITHEAIIKETAKKLKGHMEEDEGKAIRLNEAHYEQILREVFPQVTTKKRPQIQEQATAVSTTSTIILVEDQIKEMIRKVLQEKSVHKPGAELQEDKSTKKPGPADLQEDISVKKIDTVDGIQSQHCIPDALIEETIAKIREIECTMKDQLQIKGIMDKIEDRLMSQDGQILVILKLDDDWVSRWEETKNAFSMFGRIAGALMLTFKDNIARAKEYCWPVREPIDYCLLGLYRDTALELTKNHMLEDNPKIYLDILDKCKQQEFCMKIFIHALHANPRRSHEELSKLHKALQPVPQASHTSGHNSFDSNIIAKKMFMFSYSDLPKEYRSCLLYLAIFPRRQHIRRSTLIGRWVVEGLITKQDWASSVRHANRCFDALINRWLVYPADIGATGQVKSCVIGDVVHGFITKIARKQRIIETRLSHYLARHFSIFNNLRIRRSDKINRFFEKLYEESFRVSIIKVLDLEGCKCFGGKNQRYLKDICRTMVLLKYLSLRGTDVKQLPSEINNLRELEVLDIRDTHVPESATVNVLLLKLKRLLAGHTVPRAGSNEISYVPEKIGKMLNMEVLSNVKAQNHQVLKDIGKLWQLRKLGVVIGDNDKLIRNLLRAISDLHECLKSLSITLPMTEQEPSNEDFPSTVLQYYKQPPKLLLESLSITGTTKKGQLLQVLTKHNDFLQLAKITLTGTRLKQDDLKVLNKLPNIVCLRLRDKAYIDSKLTFENDKFKNLKCFLVEGSNMTDILFEGGALKLEKITLCSTDGIQSLSGVEALPELKEVELNNNNNKLSLFDKVEKVSKVTLCSTKLSEDDLKMFAKIRYMRCLVLKEKACVESQIKFNKDEFPSLNLLIVDSSAITKIEFASGSAPKLEKIIWSFTRGTVGSLSGIGNLPKLKELEFNGELIPCGGERRPCLKVAARRGTPGRKEEVRQEGACSDGDAFRAPPYTAAPAASCHGSPLRWAELAKANHHLVSHALADQPPSPGSSDCHLTVSPEMGSSATAHNQAGDGDGDETGCWMVQLIVLTSLPKEYHVAQYVITVLEFFLGSIVLNFNRVNNWSFF